LTEDWKEKKTGIHWED
jgi:hypothetical protein